METKTFTGKGDVRIAYYEGGNPDGPPMVLSNGLGGNIAAWEHLIDFFGDDYRILSWDYRGLYGSGPASSPGQYALTHHVDDLERLLKIEKVRRPILLGWSMGVQVNFEFCKRRPKTAKALVAINGVAGRPFSTLMGTVKMEKQMPPVIDTIKQHWEKAPFLGPWIAESPYFLKSFQAIGILGPTADLRVFANVAREFVQLDLGVYMEILERLGEHDARDSLPNLKIPALLVAGDRDVMTPAEVAADIVAAIPKSELCTVPGGTHYVPIEYPELLNLRIEKFIHDHLGGP